MKITNIITNKGNGGHFLKMWTEQNQHDYAYNREFQRMRYLTEEPAGDDPYAKTRDQQLVDYGYNWKQHGLNVKANKKAPHYKYY